MDTKWNNTTETVEIEPVMPQRKGTGLRAAAAFLTFFLGVSLTLGMGGVTAEVLADTVTLVLPVTEAQVLEAARGLRLWPLLDGYRGRPKADMGAVAAMAVRLGALMLADESLEEIEINPVMVREQGAVAVDALVRML